MCSLEFASKSLQAKPTEGIAKELIISRYITSVARCPDLSFNRVLIFKLL